MKSTLERLFDILEQRPTLMVFVLAAGPALDEGCSKDEAMRIGKIALAESTLTEEEARKCVEGAKKDMLEQYPEWFASSAQ